MVFQGMSHVSSEHLMPAGFGSVLSLAEVVEEFTSSLGADLVKGKVQEVE